MVRFVSQCGEAGGGAPEPRIICSERQGEERQQAGGPLRQFTVVLLLFVHATVVAGQEPNTGAADALSTTHPSTAEWTACDPMNLPGCEFVQLSGDPSLGPSVFLLRTRPLDEVRFMYHRHTNESLVVIEGTLLIVDGEGRETELGPGSFMHVPARSVHGTRCLSEPECVWYEFRDAPFDIVWALESLPQVSLAEADLEPVALTPELGAELVGRYVAGADTIEVIRAGDHIRFKTLFWRTYDLVHVGDRLFALGVYGPDGVETIAGPGARVRFVQEEGRIRSLELLLIQSGEVNFTAERLRNP